ncbi:protein of unknown function (plasmid) [Legionella fallonii LLAP-10]|uniref:Uncharacterized protein n=1 Tax=Legionella fallonii LLAP-10 TaxID=1212491 RepID=A0A098GD43_9GAMM|nr:protein of unknown function [Legionella fallonii LLAP-10]
MRKEVTVISHPEKVVKKLFALFVFSVGRAAQSKKLIPGKSRNAQRGGKSIAIRQTISP